MTGIFLGRDAFLNSSIAASGIILVIPALFWLYFGTHSGRRSLAASDKTARRLFWLTAIPLALLIAPVSSLMIQNRLGGQPLTEAMIAVPTALLTVYAFIHMSERLHVEGHRYTGAVCCLAVLILVSISIPLPYGRMSGFEPVRNAQKISPEVQTVCAITGSDPVLLPPEIDGQIGEFDNEVSPVNGALSAEVQAEYDETDAESIARTAANGGVALIVVRRTADDPAVFEESGYKKSADTDHYVIYQRMN